MKGLLLIIGILGLAALAGSVGSRQPIQILRGHRHDAEGNRITLEQALRSYWGATWPEIEETVSQRCDLSVLIDQEDLSSWEAKKSTIRDGLWSMMEASKESWMNSLLRSSLRIDLAEASEEQLQVLENAYGLLQELHDQVWQESRYQRSFYIPIWEPAEHLPSTDESARDPHVLVQVVSAPPWYVRCVLDARDSPPLLDMIHSLRQQ